MHSRLERFSLWTFVPLPYQLYSFFCSLLHQFPNRPGIVSNGLQTIKTRTKLNFFFRCHGDNDVTGDWSSTSSNFYSQGLTSCQRHGDVVRC